MNAVLIPVWKGSKNRAQTMMSLRRGQLLFGVGRGIEMLLHQPGIRFDGLPVLDSREPLLQSEVMHHSKEPPWKILAGPAALKMSVQRKEHLLDNLLTVMDRQAKGKCVTQQTIPKLIE
ncbi:MAG: hypothetical protein WA857_14295 [Candidatus Acidiferrum sp.]